MLEKIKWILSNLNYEYYELRLYFFANSVANYVINRIPYAIYGIEFIINFLVLVFYYSTRDGFRD